MNTRRTRHWAVATVAALAAAGCTAAPDDLPSALVSQSAGEKQVKLESDPIAFGEKPLWGKDSRGDYAAYDRAFEDSRVIGDRVAHYRMDDDDADGHLTVADAESGKPKWKLADDDPIPASNGLTVDSSEIHPLGESAKAKALIIVYLKPATLEDGSTGEENGIAAVSAKTGELLWHVPVVTGREYGHNVYIDATGSDYVAVSIGDVTDDSDLDDLAVVSVEEHKVLWREQNLRATGIVDDTVLTRKSVEADKSTDLLALKATNGDKLWSRDKDDDPAVLELTPDVVIAAVAGTVTVIDPKSGDMVAEPKISATDCYFDGDSAVACQALDSHDRAESAISVITLSKDSAKTRQVPKSDTYALVGMYRGRVFTEKWAGKGWDHRVLEPDGDTITDGLPGRIVDTSDHYAVFTFRNTDGSDSMVVHKVTT